ncbi:uncharacterized protein BDW47DRAFT_99124 [Aspergillus candidus]|uniref:Secreted peptide n=1 Tax=Aspergillus candidus TaxID=41067 RepID=A0A2I2FLH1_ASPCN|nr:hypothetical protein BDW47DRAFT_99124 [Aspergillus candidus]PLB41471.1 hypothetical protein BDW47DRAFT_99124 [Aspergillus candidus]
MITHCCSVLLCFVLLAVFHLAFPDRSICLLCSTFFCLLSDKVVFFSFLFSYYPVVGVASPLPFFAVTSPLILLFSDSLVCVTASAVLFPLSPGFT